MSDTLTISEILEDTHYWRGRRVYGCQSPPARPAIIQLIKSDRLPAFKENRIWIIRKSDWREFKKQERRRGFPAGNSNAPSLDRYPDNSDDWLTVREITEDIEYWRSRVGRDRVSKQSVFKMIHRQERPLPATKHQGVYFVLKADWEAFKRM